MSLAVAAILASAALGFFPSVLKADGCSYEIERNATLGAEDITRVKIIVGAGKLEVHGHSDLSEIRIRGRACASDQDTLDKILLQTGRSGNEVSVETKLPSEDRRFRARLFKKRSFRAPFLDLKIDLPVRVALDIVDCAGPVAIRGSGPVRLKDGSGEIHIERIAGEVSVQDGSGDIKIEDITGEVSVRDGSGEVEVENVTGEVSFRDGSGGIKVERVTRNVTVAQDGSGSIRARQIEGDFTVERDGSGSVYYEDVGGRVSLPD